MMKSVMQHAFSMIPSVQLQRSRFDRSHGHKTTFDASDLIPIWTEEILPGDTVQLNTNAIVRMATPLKPILDNLFLEIFYFFIPLRLLWINWQKFNGERDDPVEDYENDTEYITPKIISPQIGGWSNDSLSNYFGWPTLIEEYDAIAFYHRAYNLVFNQWFRDQNLQESAFINTSDNNDVTGNYPIRRRCKKPDYFTSSLPWPQKGPGVEIPLGGSAPVFGNGKTLGLTDGFGHNYGMRIAEVSSGITAMQDTSNAYNQNLGTLVGQAGNQGVGTAAGVVTTGESGLYADLSNATASTINSLRMAFQIQKLYERDARGGTRYTEILRSHFGVISPDARLQRPEFLHMSSTRINVNPVQQTAPSSGAPVGNLAAYATAYENRSGFVKSFVEHGICMAIVNVRADITYQQGLERRFKRNTRWDYYWPSLAHIGEQAVYNYEIYMQGYPADMLSFGFQERYSEYRHKPSIITGKFRSNDPQPLDIWHLSEEFGDLPLLNDAFIQDKTKDVLDRCIAVPGEPQFLADFYFEQYHTRAMPVYGTPGNIDHF